jgi:hypothetical protein
MNARKNAAECLEFSECTVTLWGVQQELTLPKISLTFSGMEDKKPAVFPKRTVSSTHKFGRGFDVVAVRQVLVAHT